jgi:hypothetical protein
MAWALQPLGAMADTREKFEAKDNFIRALATMLALDPTWAVTSAIQIVAEAQRSEADRRARYEEMPKAG